MKKILKLLLAGVVIMVTYMAAYAGGWAVGKYVLPRILLGKEDE